MSWISRSTRHRTYNSDPICNRWCICYKYPGHDSPVRLRPEMEGEDQYTNIQTHYMHPFLIQSSPSSFLFPLCPPLAALVSYPLVLVHLSWRSVAPHRPLLLPLIWAPQLRCRISQFEQPMHSLETRATFRLDS